MSIWYEQGNWFTGLELSIHLKPNTEYLVVHISKAMSEPLSMVGTEAFCSLNLNLTADSCKRTLKDLLWPAREKLVYPFRRQINCLISAMESQGMKYCQVIVKRPSNVMEAFSKAMRSKESNVAVALLEAKE
jgi:hypothetical protein